MTSGDLIPNDQDRPALASLEVEFALVIARMIDSLKNNPGDVRQAIYELARYKLEEQFPGVNAEEKVRTQQALETAIRGVEAFTDQHVGVLAPALQLQLNGPQTASTAGDLFYPELIPQVGPSSHLNADDERNAGGSKLTPAPWPRFRQTAAIVVILAVTLIAVQQRERLLSLAHILPKLEQKTTIEERIAPLEANNHPVPAASPAKPAPLLPTDYGVYAVSNDALMGLSTLPGRPPDSGRGLRCDHGTQSNDPPEWTPKIHCLSPRSRIEHRRPRRSSNCGQSRARILCQRDGQEASRRHVGDAKHLVSPSIVPRT